MPENHWEHFPHEADMGIRGFGDSKEAAFESAAVAMTNVITDAERVEPREKIELQCEAPEDDLLFVDWLNSLVYEMATRHMLFSRFQVKIQDHHLTGEAWGEKVDLNRHRPAVEVKGATYTQLKVDQDPKGRWRAQCVVDV